MAVKSTTTGGANVRIKKPVALFAQEIEENGTPKGDIYEFEEILRDTTSFSQDDNDTSDIENEVSDDPIDTLTTLGKIQVASTIEDVQGDLLAAFMGFIALEGKYYAPAAYSDKWAKITFVVPDQNGKNVGFTCPKVKLNTKLVLESLNSALGGFNLAGTAHSVKLEDSSDTSKEYAVGDFAVKDGYFVKCTAAGTLSTGTFVQIRAAKTPLIVDHNYTMPAADATAL